jgi:hypothetical protein
VPTELRNLSAFTSWDEVSTSATGTPAARLALPGSEFGADPLNRRERTNLGLVLFFNQAVQVFLVSCAIGIFYVAFGLFVIQPGTVKLWTGHAIRRVGPHFEFLHGQIVLSRELLITAIFVAAVSGLQFAIAAITDATYREEFYAGLTDDLRTALAARRLYRAIYADPVRSALGDQSAL